MEKQEIISHLKADARVVQVNVCDPNTNLVWGEGNLNSRIILVGEAPGGQEDRLKRPFVGPAGKLLSEELETAGIPREFVYITNVVKCRPVTLQNGRPNNRTPNAREIKAWSEILMREIQTIAPDVILCLGAIAASALIHPGFAMNAERGKWFDSPDGTQIMATFHPSYLLRTQSYGDDTPLQLFRSDLSQAIELMKNAS